MHFKKIDQHVHLNGSRFADILIKAYQFYAGYKVRVQWFRLSKVYKATIGQGILTEIDSIEQDIAFERDQSGQHAEKSCFAGTIYTLYPINISFEFQMADLKDRLLVVGFINMIK